MLGDLACALSHWEGGLGFIGLTVRPTGLIFRSTVLTARTLAGLVLNLLHFIPFVDLSINNHSIRFLVTWIPDAGQYELMPIERGN